MKSLFHFQSMPAALIVLAFLPLLCSCSKKIAFQTSPVVPAARGYIQVKTDAHNNYVVRLELTNLAESQRLTPPKNTYVLWVATENQGVKNIGQINSSSGKLKASYTTTIPFKPLRIFITAEDNGSVSFPNNNTILTTDNL